MSEDVGKDGPQLELWRRKLKQAIDDRGIAYNALSEEAGYNTQYVSKMLKGRINPTVDKILRICEVAGIEASFLFVNDDASQQTQEIVNDAAGMTEESASLVARLIESARKK